MAAMVAVVMTMMQLTTETTLMTNDTDKKPHEDHQEHVHLAARSPSKQAGLSSWALRQETCAIRPPACACI